MIAKRYAFHLDSQACAGCKACQVACKDKHGLEVGRLWRRVYEVSGGGWQRTGEAWVPDVFAFHLSISCNHCERPICAEVCPARALRRREDGIVLLDTEKCLGCRYCEWACPYGSPQYDEARGVMTKCTFCADELDEGRPPVCVTACPLRVLEFGEEHEDVASARTAATQEPLPDPQLTEPALILSEHRDARRAREERVEVIPSQRHELHEWSLVAFTLLCHLAAGSVVILGGLRLDLGSPHRAYRAILNLRSSWLSREILAATSFTVVCGAAFMLDGREVLGATESIALLWLGAFCALTLVLVISRVYRLRTVPTWNTIRTPMSFLATSWLLGSLALALLYDAQVDDPALQRWLVGGAIALLALRRSAGLVGEWWSSGADSSPRKKPWLPSSLLALSGVFLLGIVLLPASGSGDTWRDTILLLLASAGILAGEIVERHRFFKSYVRCGV